MKRKIIKEAKAEKEFDKKALNIGNIIKRDVWKRLKKTGW